MKRLAIILPILIGLTLFSCKKENIEPDLGPNRFAYPEFVDGYSIDNKTYVLVSGKLYMENMDTGEKTVYDHFDIDKSVSGMRAGGFDFEIEKLEVNVTTWGFMSRDRLELWVGSDSLDPYEIQQGSYGDRIIEHGGYGSDNNVTMKMGGSSKPFRIGVIDVENEVIRVCINEQYQSINGVQFSYFNELDFEVVK